MQAGSMNGELIFFYATGATLTIVCTIAAYNYFTVTTLENRSYTLPRQPLVSILIPARNEEKNIEDLLGCILRQTYAQYEVILLDDHSDDTTFTRAQAIASRSDRITITRGKPLPSGWTGKNWACSQLSELAKGELYLFIDADVRLASHALEAALANFYRNEVALLSCFPTQVMCNPGAWLTVPLMNWILLSFLPLSLVTTSSFQSLAAANGQFMLCDKKAYDAAGGHAVIAAEIVEDMAFARRLKAMRYRIVAVLGHDAVSCSMYGGFLEGLKGFAKNFFPALNVSGPTFLLMLALLLFAFFTPFIFSWFNLLFLLLVVLILLERAITSLLSSQNLIINLLLHPLQMISMTLIGLYSLYWSLTGKTIWKGRRI